MIRSRPVPYGAEFFVVDAKSLRLLGGPFALLADAISFAVTQITADGRLLYEALDERGRTTGGPVLLRPTPA